LIRFNLLGEVVILGEPGAHIDQRVHQPKRLALLAYLASPAPGSRHRRDVLLSLFWPELDTSHARTALRNAIYVLRQHLGEGVVISRGDEEVSLDPNLIETDVSVLREAIRSARVAEALELYKGELLPGIHVLGSEGFERWLDAERGRLRLDVAKAGLAWVGELESGGKLRDAVSVTRRILEIHPDDETAVRRLMSLHQALGDRAGALSAFEDYRARLMREFDAQPAAETLALAERLRNPGDTVPVSDVVAPDSGQPRQTPLPVIAGAAAGAAGESRSRRAGDGRRPAITVGLLAVAAVVTIAIVGGRVSHGAPLPAIGQSNPVTTEEGLQIEPAISPNGRLVAYAKGNPQRMRIYVQRLEGGAPWTLSGDSNSVELLPRWSPDNDALVFLSRNNAYVTPAVGGPPRLVAAGGEGEAAVRSASWSPDGDSLLIVRRDSLLVRPLEGPGARFVGTGLQLHACVWSPDGRWIACTSGNWIAYQPGTLFGNQAPSAIVLFPATGGAPIELTDREHAYHSPAWSADGKYLWLLSNRDGVWGEVYALRIGHDGRPEGSYQRMGLRAESITLSEGRIVYSVYSRRANAWAVPIGHSPPATLRDAVRVTSGNQIVEVLHVSKDGTWLVYDSDVRGNADIYRVPTAGGASERLTDDPRPEYTGDFSPDDRFVAYHLWKDGMRRLMVKDLTDGTVTEIVPAPGDQGTPRWSPDGNALVVWEHGSEPGSIFVVRRDSTGRWSPAIWRLEDAQLPLWSPDGTTIAYLKASGAIELIPADSGASRVLYNPRSASNDPIITFLAWDKGRDEIWALGHDSAGNGGIWGVSLRTGTPRLLVDLRDPGGMVNGPSVTSDGARFYFTLDERLSNVRWAELVSR